MAKGILGRKIGMTQIYSENGDLTPVTIIEAGPCSVLQLKTVEKDGYEAVQLGFLDKPRRLAIKSERGHVAAIGSKRAKLKGDSASPKADCEPKKFVREIRGSADGLEVGSNLAVDCLDGVIAVDVVGTSKGRGFSGVMKRHNFSGQRATHGVKKCHRHAGGTGMSAYPSRLFKGKRMAGQYGNTQVTTRNVKVVKVDPENNVLLIKGAIPGPNGGYVVVKETNKV
ncbi:50S ribosomal protein L3 [bacterium]|jgi:large subunit ribosomal protein L3|nr:50S ribosomal protein L3 [bacterium]